MGREEYSEKENLQQRYLSHDIDEIIKKILENPSEDLIHQLMYYVELRTLRNFQRTSPFTFVEDTITEYKNEI